jgi:group I intron endonuclease
VIYGLHSGDNIIRYVGRTSRGLEQRLWEHKNNSRLGERRPVYDWMRKYGAENIQGVVLELCFSPEETVEREKFWITEMHPNGLMNCHDVLDGVVRIDPNARAKISESLKRYFASEGYPRLGQKHTPETRAKLSALAMGRTPWNKGRPGTQLGKKGEDSNQAKLTEVQVRQIIGEGKWSTYSEVGKKWGVTAEQISLILRNKSWKHIDRGDI